MGESFVHPALFYRGADEYLAGTVPFVREGLAAGEPVAVSVPAPNLALIEAALGPDARRVRLLDMTRVGRNPGRIIPGVLPASADAHGDEPVRIIGDPVWAGRSATEYPACAQHEALINLAFAGRRVTILCPYDAERLDPAVLADAAATHPVLVDGDGSRRSDDYDPHRVVAAYNQPFPEPAGAATFAFDLNRLAELRRFTTEQAARAGLPDDRGLDVALAVNELASNSIGYRAGEGTLRVWVEDRHLVCQVHDAGRPVPH